MAKQNICKPIDELVLKDDTYPTSNYTTTYSNTFIKESNDRSTKTPPVGRR